MARSDWLCTGTHLDGTPCRVKLGTVASRRDLRLSDAAGALVRDRARGGWLVLCDRCKHPKRWPGTVAG